MNEEEMKLELEKINDKLKSLKEELENVKNEHQIAFNDSIEKYIKLQSYTGLMIQLESMKNNLEKKLEEIIVKG